MRLIVGLAALLLPAVAVAQPGAAPSSDADPPARVAVVPAISVAPPGVAALADRDTPEPDAPPPAPVGIARRVDQDAASGRAFFTDTALTAPRGKVSLSFRMPAAPVIDAELRYSFTDRIELGISGMTVLVEDELSILGLHAKGQVWRNNRAAVAVGLKRYQDVGSGGDDGVTIPTVVATTCLDGADCFAIISLSLNGVIISDESDVPVFAGASWALGRTIQFVGEIHVSNDDNDGSLAFGFLGVRGASRGFALDAGIGFGSEGSCSGCGSNTEAFPFFGIGARL